MLTNSAILTHPRANFVVYKSGPFDRRLMVTGRDFDLIGCIYHARGAYLAKHALTPSVLPDIMKDDGPELVEAIAAMWLEQNQDKLQVNSITVKSLESVHKPITVETCRHPTFRSAAIHYADLLTCEKPEVDQPNVIAVWLSTADEAGKIPTQVQAALREVSPEFRYSSAYRVVVCGISRAEAIAASHEHPTDTVSWDQAAEMDKPTPLPEQLLKTSRIDLLCPDVDAPTERELRMFSALKVIASLPDATTVDNFEAKRLLDHAILLANTTIADEFPNGCGEKN